MPNLTTYIEGWQPEPRVDYDPMPPQAAHGLATVLDVPGGPGEFGHALPPLWHWVYFLRWQRLKALGTDGHPANGHFLPPIPDRRRMFAGGRLRIYTPLTLGQTAERTSTVLNIAVKQGRTGEMAFVTVRSEFRQGGDLRLVEEQDLVYRSGDVASRGDPLRSSARPPRSAAPWSFPFTADPVGLFRFSAVTANAHRIHYDLPYARDVERYPGLVVHGPLLVLLMAELARAHSASKRVASVDYRLQRPAFAGDPLLVTGDPDDDVAAHMAVLGGDDQVLTQAKVMFGQGLVGDIRRPVHGLPRNE